MKGVNSSIIKDIKEPSDVDKAPPDPFIYSFYKSYKLYKSKPQCYLQLAKPFEVEDLARGINWVLEDTERYNQLCIRARQKVEQQFTLELQAQKYLELYSELLSKSNG